MSNILNIDKFIYKVYGLNVISDIEIPQLIQATIKDIDEIDVAIKLGKMPGKISGYKAKKRKNKYRNNIMWINIDNVAQYYIYKGREIVIEPYDESDINDIRVFLLGTIFGGLLTQRQILAIHGGSVDIDGNGIIITGDSGCGKSTLTSALVDIGYNMITDDVAAIRKSDKGKILIEPAYPQRKLCKDAIHNFGYDLNKFNKAYGQRDKLFIRIPDKFSYKPVKLKAIFEICISDNNKVEIEEINGFEKIDIIRKNIYREEILNKVGMKEKYFNMLLNLSKDISIYRIKRPLKIFTLKEQIDEINKVLCR